MIKTMSLTNFMGISTFDASDFAPVNLILGKNDSGKTGLLKLLYASAKTIDIYSRRSKDQDVNFKKLLSEKLYDTFQPGRKGLGELVSKAVKEKLSVNLSFSNPKLPYEDRLYFTFGDSTTNTIVDCPESLKTISENFRCLFIPAKEALTALKAIRATRDNLHIQGFDDTYLDLIRALVIPGQRGNFVNELKEVSKRMEQLFDGRIEQGADDEFIFKRGNAEFQMQLTAEGIKKIGILSTLIQNRQLNATSVLFLDEPETALHPHAVRALVEMLMLMAQSGMQIFMATHNYFVLKQTHISARKYNIETNAYALYKEKDLPFSYKKFDLKNDFPENSISDEAMLLADEEIQLDLGS